MKKVIWIVVIAVVVWYFYNKMKTDETNAQARMMRATGNGSVSRYASF